jgi:NADH:ubiquinone oxidoreductase subunit 6 (subunit J)
MTAELVLFIVVAAVAILSAALMLVSRSAVHSVLFLVVNLLCVAFFYLMLNAPFLAMVQITVYAGAIMVLFMFVIMLLGAEKVGGGAAKYGWIAPAAAVLTAIFLVVSFVVIVQENIGLFQPVPRAPAVRFVHASPDAPTVDLYLNADRVASDLAYRQWTAFTDVQAGAYNLLAFPACTEPDPAICPAPVATGASPLLAVPLTLEPETETTFVLAGSPEQLQVVPAVTSLETLADENTWLLTVVNVLPGYGPLSFAQINLADPNAPTVLVAALEFGAVSPALTLPRGTYDFAWQQGDRRIATLREMAGQNKTHELLVLLPEPALTLDGSTIQRPAALRIDPPPRTREAFGSPQQIGVELLTNYLLPFEMVALLLLGAMVGAIILTREEVVRRARQRVVVSPLVKRLNRGLSANTARMEQPASSAEPARDAEPSSAD